MACEMPGCSPVIALPHVPLWVVRITVDNLSRRARCNIGRLTYRGCLFLEGRRSEAPVGRLTEAGGGPPAAVADDTGVASGPAG
jgi:hypothetical protein